MPNQRSPDQSFLGTWCELDLVAAVDSARKAKGNLSRSQFARDALVAAARAEGISLKETAARPPDRVGKGGPKKSIS